MKQMLNIKRHPVYDAVFQRNLCYC